MKIGKVIKLCSDKTSKLYLEYCCFTNSLQKWKKSGVISIELPSLVPRQQRAAASKWRLHSNVTEQSRFEREKDTLFEWVFFALCESAESFQEQLSVTIF